MRTLPRADKPGANGLITNAEHAQGEAYINHRLAQARLGPLNGLLDGKGDRD